MRVRRRVLNVGAAASIGVLGGALSVLGGSVIDSATPAGAVNNNPAGNPTSPAVSYEADCTSSLEGGAVAPFVSSTVINTSTDTATPTGATFGVTGTVSQTIVGSFLAAFNAGYAAELGSEPATLGLTPTETFGSTDGHATGTYTYTNAFTPVTNPGTVVKAAGVTEGSTTVTGDFSGATVGDAIADNGGYIPSGATVTAVNGTTSATISEAATGTDASDVTGYAPFAGVTYTDSDLSSGDVFTTAGTSGETAGIGITSVTSQVITGGIIPITFGGSTGQGPANCLETGWVNSTTPGPGQGGGATPPLETQPVLPNGTTTALVDATPTFEPGAYVNLQAAPVTTLYVAQGGTNTGTCASQASPCATITYALTQAVANDTIDVSGTINDGHIIISSVPVTITGANAPPGSPAVIDGDVSGKNVFQVENTATFDNLTIENGTLGGIEVTNAGSLTINDSTISGNTDTSGGGIDNNGALVVNDSTISGNSATTQAGGIFNGGNETASAVITNSTISDNSSDGGGGGIVNVSAAGLTVTSSTISGNTAKDTVGGGIENANTAHIGSSIVAGNTVYNGDTYNCGGGEALTSVGYNLTDDATGTTCGFTQPTDLVDVSPQLGPLQNNGGPTETMQPAAGSKAGDQIPPGTTLNNVQVCPGTDQRGDARPANGATNCTIGAVEVGTAPPVVIPTLTAVSGPASLVVGQSGTFTATVTPASGSKNPQGVVTFSARGSIIGSARLNGSSPDQATLTRSFATAGTPTVTATYKGTTRFGSSFGTTGVAVSAASTTTTLSVSPASPTKGEDATFTATVSVNSPGSGTPKGVVTFKSGTTIIGSASLNGSSPDQATIIRSFASAGSKAVTASYKITQNYNPSTGSQTVVVTK